MHISNHKNPANEYFCPFCGLTFAQFLPLSEHFFQKHIPKKNLYPCFRCKRIYMVGRYFDSHECSGEPSVKKVKTESAVECERCSVTFSSQDEYVCHQFLGCRKSQPHYCVICDKTFLTKNRLQKHENASHVQKMKAFICDICGHGSVDKTRYDIHKSTHETERKFKCHYAGCKAAFKHNTLFKSHIKQHEKVNTYECDLCHKHFPFYALIKRHMASSHSDSSEFRSFACEICGKRTISAAALLKHKFAHTGERSVKCKACPKKFSDTSAR
jgi:KRAB domain-containing zinc finger protein